MGAISLEFDAAGSNIDGTNPGTALALSAANGYALLSFDAPEPDRSTQWAGSIDTEGDTAAARKSNNRTVTARYRLTGASDAALESSFNTLDKKIEKVTKEGGTLKLTTPAGTVGYLDIRDAGQAFPWDHRLVRIQRAEVTFTLTCAPFIRGTESDLGDNTETTNPALIFSDTVPGAVDALGRLVIDDDQGVDQWWVIFGVEDDSKYTHTTSSGSGALFYEAESRTVLGGSSVVTGPSGASGGASNNVVRQTALATSDQAILSTQATGGGSHLSHVGTFRVFARVQVPTANVGDVTLTLGWAVGDFRRFTLNKSVTIDEEIWVSNAVWRLVDLGAVTIPPARAGATQRWEGRVLARSTAAGDDIDIDYVMLIPADKASGEISALPLFQTPTSISARDEFDQSAGALAGKTLPVGGTWSGAGDTDDFSVETTGHTARRTAVSDSSGRAMVNGRVAIAGTATFSNVYVQVFQSSTSGDVGGGAQWGVFARYTDANNWLAATVTFPQTNTILTLYKMVSGTAAALATRVEAGAFHPAGVTKGMRLQVDDQGRVFVWIWTQGYSPGSPVLAAQHADLATGGSLATGKVGFVDFYTGSQATTRTYDDFAAAVPVKDAAIFASQSLEITHAQAQREDSGGAFWVPVPLVGDRLMLPPAGNEGRSTRVIVKACRNDPSTMPDSNIDDISARLLATPRFPSIPD